MHVNAVITPCQGLGKGFEFSGRAVHPAEAKTHSSMTAGVKTHLPVSLAENLSPEDDAEIAKNHGIRIPVPAKSPAFDRGFGYVSTLESYHFH